MTLKLPKTVRTDRRQYKLLFAGGGAPANLKEGLCAECLGDGWYRIELATFNESPPSEYDGQSCDLCAQATNVDYTDDCESITTFDPDKTRPVGTNQFVYAHDARTLKIKDGGHVRMLPIHKDPQTNEQLYAVVSAEYEMLKVPVTDWECCNGEVIQTRCDFLLIEGTLCEVWTDECYP
jgi:hypothetical protein